MAEPIQIDGENSTQEFIEIPATQQSQSITIATLVDQIIEAPHQYKGRDDFLCWEIIEELIKRVPKAGDAPAARKNTPPDTEDIRQSLKRLETKVSSLLSTKGSPNAGATWATVAAAGSPQAAHQRNADAPPPLRKTRELIVRIHDREQAQKTQLKPSEQILKEIADKSPKNREQIASIRRLQSGDIALHTTSSEARKELEKKTDWIKGIAVSAKVIRQTFAVLTHGVRTSLDTRNMETTISKMQKDNERLHPGLEIIRIAWPKRVIDSGKTHSSLIVEVADETMANRLLDHGLVEGHTECSCEYFDKRSRIIQCFNCFEFGHMARGCRKTPECHKCGQKHKAEDCRPQVERMHCANCKKEGHKPWMRSCPIWQAKKRIADEFFRNRPHRYPESTGKPIYSFSAATTVASSTVNEGEEAWTEVTSNNKKRKVFDVKKPGRPTGATNAKRSQSVSQPTITFPSTL
jgi:hypothetical protein